MSVDDGNYEHFRVGMRVLAVDDHPLCLKLLENLLRKCEYNVTTTSEARTALQMLRENKDGFDLVISDVHMPGMDGFRLLELVGLEMDLPVILLSINGDPKNIAKGLIKGASDYLVKPVRLEELKNVWQHVLRKKKVKPKNLKKCSDQGQAYQASGEGHTDQNGKFNRKRKDEEDESEDNGNESNPGTQKKPRVVWSIDLHRKFVAAVNQLGIEKAVPKRILDLMNDDRLTRENVASHLEKYRLYLKRISSATDEAIPLASSLNSAAATQQANMINGFAESFTKNPPQCIIDQDKSDPGTQEKPRVVWSAELHGKFVAVVNQLGIENAVPKRILDLMHDDMLTPEDVALHLEKYRLYLKRISSARDEESFTKRILNLMNDDRLTQEDIANHLQKYKLHLKRFGSVAATQRANMISWFSMLPPSSEPDTQNKPRIIWTIDLHTKFVAAIDQLFNEKGIRFLT